MSTVEVLVMSFLEGEPIENLSNHSNMELRNRVASTLLELSMRELFEWGLVQTDPNFANYRYNEQTGRIQLFDFGATRVFSIERRQAFQALISAAINGDETDILNTAEKVGYLKSSDPEIYQQGIVELVGSACEPISYFGSYDFGQSDLASRMATTTMNLRVKEKFGRLPPPDVLFLHRKIAGLYLLLNRLRAVIPVRQIVAPFIKVVVLNSSAPV
jgi:predicted unusual protein kinase regulating ubiquinone biosynthesis (AarF/ABC1/UbiB family)